jgi:hypothetical protein
MLRPSISPATSSDGFVTAKEASQNYVSAQTTKVISFNSTVDLIDTTNTSDPEYTITF